jgi:predicted transcriptional regulator of viral defense system
MHTEYNKNINISGISKRNRELLDKLNREIKSPFSITEVSMILGINLDKARRLVAYWVSRGWLTRIKKGLFITVPLGTVNPAERKENPWIVATIVFNPCYIGGWSACEHWGLTEQIFKDVVVFFLKETAKGKKNLKPRNDIHCKEY